MNKAVESQIERNKKRDYVTDPRGHVWETDENGDIGIFAFYFEHHNGPRCKVCGYCFCHHCQSMSLELCVGEK